jgi:hypothetical protein
MARSDPDWKFYRLDHIHRVLHVVHASGVNMRFLIQIMFHSRTKVSQHVLLVEATSRTVKKELRALMRKALQTSSSQAGGVHDVLVTKVVIDYWNTLLSQRQATVASTKLWDAVASALQAYFGVLDPMKLWRGADLRHELLCIPLGMLLLFLRVNEQLGLQWSSRVTQLVEDSIHWLEGQEEDRSDTAPAGQRGAARTLRRLGLGGLTASLTASGAKVPSSRVSRISDSDISSKSNNSPVNNPLSSSGAATSPSSGPVEAATQQPQPEQMQTQNPWSFWTQQSTLFFEDDLLDVGSRTKLNNQAAMAMGSKLMLISDDTADRELKAHFRLLASRFFDSALMSNPTSPVTLRLQARILILQEGYRLGVLDPMAPKAMVQYFWSATLRYIDFLYRVALKNDPHDSAILYSYAQFLASGGQSKYQECWFLTRAVCADHDNVAAIEALKKCLTEMDMGKEQMILDVWSNGGQKLVRLKA